MADEEEVPLGDLLGDASGRLIDCSDVRRIHGFAAYGASIGDGLRGLIDVAGVELTERDGRLATPDSMPVALIDASELGCDADGEARPAIELARTSSADRPAALSLTYYDQSRDYQAGQMRSSGGSGTRDERIELPSVMSASEAKQLVEEAFARRWRGGERLKLRLPPSRMGLCPGKAIQLEGAARAWLVRSLSIEGMAVAIEAQAAPVEVPVLPAAPPWRPASRTSKSAAPGLRCSRCRHLARPRKLRPESKSRSAMRDCGSKCRCRSFSEPRRPEQLRW